MSSFQPKNSILLRKKKEAGASLSNSEHLEQEHLREEAKLAAKREMRQQREIVRGQQLWGSKEERAGLAEKERAEHDALLASRRRNAEAERVEEERLKQSMLQREADVRRAELAKIEAKREYLASLREDNFRLAEQRKQMQQNQREEERAVSQQSQGSSILDRFGRHAY